MHLEVKEVPIEEAVKVNATITEFIEAGKPYPQTYFTQRYEGKKHLILVAYVDQEPAGYVVSYQRYEEDAFYCWMAGVDPQHRKKGVLKAMMDYQETWARQNNYKKIKIKTRNNIKAMLHYLVKYDFKFTEVIKKGHKEDWRIFAEKEL